MRGDQLLATVGQFPQEFEPNARSTLRIVLETVVPVGMIKADGENCVTRKGQPVTSRRNTHHTVSRRVSARAVNYDTWRDLIFVDESLDVSPILRGELLRCRTERVRETLGHVHVREIGIFPEA